MAQVTQMKPALIRLGRFYPGTVARPPRRLFFRRETTDTSMKKPLSLFLAGCFLAFADAALAADEAPAAPALDLLEYEVHGNTVLTSEAVEEAVYPYLGPRRTVADVEKARKALEKAYHDAGYLTVYVDIPEQGVAGGVIKLRVTEGKVGRLKVAGAEYTLPSRIRSDVPSVAEGQVPYFPELQKELADANRAPGVRVAPVLQAGAAPGTVDVNLNIEDRPPLSAWIGVNNAYSPNTTHERVNGGLRYDNLFQRAHSLSIQYQTSPREPSETSAISVSYVLPFNSYRRYLSFYGIRSESNVAALGDLVSIGNGNILGARLILPFTGRRGLFHNVSLGLDYKDFQESLIQGPVPAIETPIHYWTFNAAYAVRAEDDSGAWQMGAGAVLGLRGLGSGETAFENKRYGAHGSFAVLKLDGQREERLGSGWSLLGRLNAQLATEPLISNEQFSAGGAGSVRGYLLSEALGDYGLRGSLEARTPPFAFASWPALKRLQPYVFVDGAHLRVIDALPAQKDRHSLWSAGLGLLLETRQTLSLDVNLAVPLRDSPYTSARETRVQFDARLNF